MDEPVDPQSAEFCYQFLSNGSTYLLNLPLKLPYVEELRELAVRLVGAHKIPCHLEDDLCEKLQEFVRSATVEMLDQQAENNFYGGSVFEKVGGLLTVPPQYTAAVLSLQGLGCSSWPCILLYFMEAFNSLWVFKTIPVYRVWNLFIPNLLDRKCAIFL